MKRQKRVRKRFDWRWLIALGLAMFMLAGLLVMDTAKAQNTSTASTPGALSKYTLDLTAAAEQGRFDSFTDRRDEINRAIAILSSPNKNNPVVLSDSPAVRAMIAAGVAQRIVSADVPEALYGRRLLKLNLEALFRDSKTAAALVTNITAILSEVAQSDSRIILLVDPIQSLMGPCSAFDGAASAMLRDAIRTDHVQFFGASTDLTFKQSVVSDESLAALFAGVEMQEVNDSSEQTEDSAKAK